MNGKDTLNNRSINFPEGDTIIIDQPGGDRTGYEQTYVVANGQLINTYAE